MLQWLGILSLSPKKNSRVAKTSNPAILNLKTRGFPAPPYDRCGFIIQTLWTQPQRPRLLDQEIQFIFRIVILKK